MWPLDCRVIFCFHMFEMAKLTKVLNLGFSHSFFQLFKLIF